MRSRALLLSLTLATATAAPAFSSTPYARGRSVTLILPLEALSSGRSSYSASVSVDQDGRLVLNHNPAWRSVGMPLVMPGIIRSIANKKKTHQTTVEVSAALPWQDSRSEFKFEIPDSVNDWEAALDEIVVNLSPAEEGYYDEVDRRLSPRLREYARMTFSGALAQISEKEQLAILLVLQSQVQSSKIRASKFKGTTYLCIDFPAGRDLYNSLQVNQNQRVAREITGKVFPLAKALGSQLEPTGSLGLEFTLQIPFKSFLDKYANPKIDALSVYVPINDAKSFAEFEITDQDLIERSVVLLNGSRVNVVLIDQ